MKRLTVAVLLSTLAACAPSDPKLSYSGLTAENAIKLFDLSQNCNERTSVITKLEHDRRPGFDWVYFWKNLNSARTQRLERDSLHRVFALSVESCAPEAFELFASDVLTADLGFEFVFGPQRSCAQPLGRDLFAKYVDHFRANTAALFD